MITRLVSPVGVTRHRALRGLDGLDRRNARNRRSEGVCLRFSVCAPVGIRTPNLLIRSQMLYPLSYRRLSRCEHTTG